MFTGIIEEVGRVSALRPQGKNLDITIDAQLSSALKIDQSVSHNGVCLTVVDQSKTNYRVTAVDETLKRTNLSKLEIGDYVNLERGMKMDARLDGHLVQGHIDQTGICQEIIEKNGSFLFTFSYDETQNNVTIEKGSITVNGVSLTVVDSHKDRFNVAIIPYTFNHTNFQYLHPGDHVNLEFDLIGKYLQRLLKLQEKN